LELSQLEHNRLQPALSTWCWLAVVAVAVNATRTALAVAVVRVVTKLLHRSQ
jgi:hypothetical protein